MSAALRSIQYEPAGQFEATRYEKVHNVIFQDSDQGSLQVAKEISDLIREKSSKGQKCVQGACRRQEQGNRTEVSVPWFGKLSSNGRLCEI